MSIQVTVGQVPGAVKDVTLDEVVTIAEAIRKAGFSADGYEIRINNVVTTDFNHELENEDIVSLVKNVKGNASATLLSINVTLPGGETKRVLLLKGEFLISLKKSLGLPGKFSDYKWIVAGEEQTNKQYELTRDCNVNIELARATEEADITSTGEEPTVAPEKKTSEKKTQEKDGSETVMTVKWLDGATTIDMEVRHGMRCSEFLRVAHGPDAKWSDYIVSKNGKLVKLGFMQLKDGDIVTIEKKGVPELDIATPCESVAEPVEETAKEDISETCCEATEEATSEPCAHEESVAEPVEEAINEPCTCEHECTECNCRDSAQDTRTHDKKLNGFNYAVRKVTRCIDAGYEIVSVGTTETINTSEDPDTGELKESSELYLSVVIRKFA